MIDVFRVFPAWSVAIAVTVGVPDGDGPESHRTEPERYAKYPPLPVAACPGFEPRQETLSGSTRTR